MSALEVAEAPRRRTATLTRRALPAALAAWAALAALACATALAQPPAADAAQKTPIGFADALARARTGPSVALARLGLEQAQATRDASASPVSATLKTGYSYAWQASGGESDSSKGQLQPFSLNATLNVVPYGPSHDARESAERALETARMTLRDAVAQATVDAATSYLQALRAQQRLAIDQQALMLAQASLDHVRAQRAAGDATQEALDAAGVALLQAQTTLASDRLGLQGALATLSDLVGATVEAVAGEPPAASDPAVEEDAAERRTDVRAAVLAVTSGRQAYAAAMRQALPAASASAALQGGDGTTTWSAGIGYGTASFQPTLDASVDPTAGTTAGTASVLDGTRFALSVAVSIPLDAGVGAALDSARLAVASAEQKLARTRQQAELAIAGAERTLAGDHLAAALAERQQQQADAQAAQAQQRFDLGLIAEPDLEQARINTRRAALAAAAASDTVLVDRLELARAIGHDPMEVF